MKSWTNEKWRAKLAFCIVITFVVGAVMISGCSKRQKFRSEIRMDRGGCAEVIMKWVQEASRRETPKVIFGANR
jgi:hypothetical protein